MRMTQLFSHDKKMASFRRLPFKQSIHFTRTIARSFFTDIVPVDDHINGLNDTQQQVRYVMTNNYLFRVHIVLYCS